MTPRHLIVNALTFSRMPLILVWMVFAVIAELRHSWILAVAGGVFMACSGFSDLLDGKLARKWRVVSNLGKMADPLMDKVFYLVVFPTLLWISGVQHVAHAHTLLLLVFAVSYLLRDTWVTFLRSVGTVYGADVSAMWLGKVRTALSFPGAGWVYAYLALHRFCPSAWNAPWLVSCYFVELLLLALTGWSLVTYSRAYAPFLKKALAENGNL